MPLLPLLALVALLRRSALRALLARWRLGCRRSSPRLGRAAR
ncbi:MAG TPA: hypothetical protein VKB57_23670 [Acidimicrobiales bacterium]|nr:hypothetical protein [Acidimicrobiales bacterium]